ncbi:hypothetical protein K3495_g4196 [Podosphaera aphanis]|nr:hypothetical protein K3495_g4196 [Podosphaera aphanis]
MSSCRDARRLSGPWNRFKITNQEFLETIGFPSKGDKKLLDYKTQEIYYTRIIERYMAFCSDAGRGDELSRRLASFDISNDTVTPSTALNGTTEKEILNLLIAIRKLREGIVASKRVDNFSIQAYIFSIRLSILVKHVESYHPALLFLLKKMHPIQPLASTELQEVIGYLILDLACRQNELALAYSIRSQYRLHDTKIDTILRALTHNNYFLFWRVKRTVDGHKAKLMEFAEDAIRRHTLKCLGRSYLRMDLAPLENFTNSSWSALTNDCGVGWQLEDGHRVIIRKQKAR